MRLCGEKQDKNAEAKKERKQMEESREMELEKSHPVVVFLFVGIRRIFQLT